ncbi:MULTISPECIES: hypothetical protein [Halorubrum]|mgnify:FL=1|uniref:hypothetical protein n=1 Tax=Halorubrum TaxID=56688 RepID=UPI000F85064F|nr:MULTISPECIES: hypothetical protein [Halorubrum]AZQ13771.1 hypothetical protein DOS48_02450 [Halorubrum sp. PV6]
MESAVLLRCSLCDAVFALEGRRNEYSRQDLFSRAKAHLREHELDEPKTAIRKYGIVSAATEIVIPQERHQQLPTEEWTDLEDTWLPDGALSHDDGFLSAHN